MAIATQNRQLSTGTVQQQPTTRSHTMKRQYVIVSREHGIERATRPVTPRGIERICHRDNVNAYEVAHELNHEAFPPSEDTGVYFLMLVIAGDVPMSAEIAISTATLKRLGYTHKGV
jgi:hypothetical protein